MNILTKKLLSILLFNFKIFKLLIPQLECLRCVILQKNRYVADYFDSLEKMTVKLK